MADGNAKSLIARSEKMFSTRESVVTLWQELADQFYPERGQFTVTRDSGDEFADHLFATDPVLMRRDLGNAISAMTRPGGRQWGKPDIDDADLREDASVRAYLDWLGETQWRAMYDPPANFVRATKEADHDLATFGNAVVSVEPNMRAGRLLYSCHHLKDCAWADNAEGRTDMMHRRITISARAAEQKWGRASLHQNIQKLCEKEPEKDVEFIHVMMPAADYDYITRAKPKIKAPFVSIYVDKANGCIVNESPSFEFRYIVQRWTTLPNSPYAVSPATMTALPDARMMQALARIIQEAGEKSVDPPMKVTEEAVRGEINLFAGGATWVDREYDERLGPAVEPIMLGKDAGLGLNMFDRIRLGMIEAFYLNKLSMPQQAAKTAYETAQLVEENLRASAPLFEPMEQNNAAILDTTFEVLQRVGTFGPPDTIPEVLRGKNISFSFSNPLHDAIERAKVLQFQGTTQLMAMGAQFDPKIVADIDMRQAFRDAAMGSGMPAKWLRKQEDADDGAEAMAKEQELAKIIGAAGAGGQAVEAVGKGAMAVQGKRAA